MEYYSHVANDKYNIYTQFFQVQFSLLSRDPLSNGLADVCAEFKIQPIAYSPLALGLLADKYTIDRWAKLFLVLVLFVLED